MSDNTISGESALTFGGNSVNNKSKGTNPYNSSPFPLSVLSQNSSKAGNEATDKASVIWRDFLGSLKHRKRLINQFRKVALDITNPVDTLKRLLLEIRQITLSIAEDALEIEYRFQLNGKKSKKRKNNDTLPPIASFEKIKDKEDISALSDMITDLDDIFLIPNVKSFLPNDFPTSRNPFMLGKSVDELAILEITPPQPGNLENELKMLDLLRYKRAASALLKAETQVENKMPLTLKDVERLWFRMHDNTSVNAVIRAVCSIIYNSGTIHVEEGTELRYLKDRALYLEPKDFLHMLNNYNSNTATPIRAEIIAAIQQSLRDCSMDSLKDYSCSFLVEFLRVILGKDCFQTIQDGSIFTINSEDSSNNNNNNKSFAQNKSSSLEDTASTLPKKKKKGIMRQSSTVSTLNPLTTTSTSLMTRKVLSHNSNMSTKPDKDKQEKEDLSAIRYELLKMQQELLRRKVLDPRHYHAGSIDNTVPQDIKDGKKSVLQPMEKYMDNNIAQKSSIEEFVCFRTVNWSSGRGIFELFLDPLEEVLIGRVSQIHDEESVERHPHAFVGQKEYLFSVKFSKLMVNRVTGFQLENILESPAESPQRTSQLSTVFIQIKSYLDAFLIDRKAFTANFGTMLLPKIDRTLFRCTMTSGGIAVEVVVSRNIDCTGVCLVCTPLPGSTIETTTVSSPVTVVVLDKELLVLLINQRGLFTLSQSKWQSLEYVCQWLTGRIKVKRIPIYGNANTSDTIDYHTDGGYNLPTPLVSKFVTTSSSGPSRKNSLRTMDTQHSSMSLLAGVNAAAASPSTFSTLQSMPSSASASNRSLNKQFSSRPSNTLLIKPEGNIVDNMMTQTAEFVDFNGGQRGPVLLEVSIDRRVDIPENALTQWRSRNLPNIPGATYNLEAWQDMEMLCFNIFIRLPRKKLRPSQSEKEKRKRAIQKRNLDRDIDYATEDVDDDYDEFDDDDVYQDFDSDDIITIPLSYRLSGLELLIFGSVDYVEESSISISTKGKGNHPAAFMWRVLSRLHVIFKGSKSNPYSTQCYAGDSTNWSVNYERRLLRDIRTISGGVMVVSAFAIGNELLFDSKPTDGSIFKTVGSKLFTEGEIKDLVLGEGWPLHLLDPGRKVELALRILERMKVIEEKMVHRLECYNYPETRILAVALMAGVNKSDSPLGSVEINEHMTLSDLRSIIAHELDRDLIPKAYRFMYKASPCAAKQEGFRKAWETLPKIVILARPTRQGEVKGENKEVIGDKEKEDRYKALKAQRRLNKKLVPVPICTLVRVQEDSSSVITLHDIRELLFPGDVIRIGHINARDYLIPMMEATSVEMRPPRAFLIEPAFDMVNEDETPFVGNNPLLPTETLEPLTEKKKSVNFEAKNSRPTTTQNGNGTGSGGESVSSPTSQSPNGNNNNEKNSFNHSTNKSEDISKNPKRLSKSDSLASISSNDFVDTQSQSQAQSQSMLTRNDSQLSLITKSEGDNQSSVLGTPVNGNRFMVDSKSNSSSNNNNNNIGNVWADMWLWKCVPRSEDSRPRWRQKYDDGLIPYIFEYQHRVDGPTYFRVPVQWRLMESFCRDSRCPDLTIYRQRIDEMGLITVDHYTELAFKEMCNWYPKQLEFIDVNKFMKLIRDVQIFSDIKRPARSGQMEQIFLKEVKTFGLAERYATYAGFCRVLQQVALIRFPYGRSTATANSSAAGSMRRQKGKTLSPVIHKNGDDMSIYSLGSRDSASKGNNSIVSSTITKTTIETRVGSPKRTVSRNRSKSPKKDSNKDNTRPEIDPVHAAHAYGKLVTDYLMLIPEWSEKVWVEAKQSAMTKEAIRYAAATRIIARWRCSHQHHQFKVLLHCIIRLQANIRRSQISHKFRRLISCLLDDWLFRTRYYAVSLVQASVRRYIIRCRHLKLLKVMRAQQIAISVAKRNRLKKIRAKMRKGVIYKEIRSVSGVMVVIRIHRKDQRNYSKDFGVVLEVYVPKHGETHKFTIAEDMLRQYMVEVLGMTAISPGDLLDGRHLEKIISSRLICRSSKRADKPPKVIFSHQPLGQRGAKVMTHGVRFSGEEFVCNLYETGADISVQCYHRFSCKIFESQISTAAIQTWISRDFGGTSKAADTDNLLLHPLLLPENKVHLYMWMLNHMVVDKRHGTFKVMFACQLEKSRKLELIVKLQSMWRKAIARKRLFNTIDKTFVKVNGEDGFPYYLNIFTGESSWEKPIILGQDDLPSQPSYRWVKLPYYQNGELYVNPINGVFSTLSESKAAQRVISRARNWFLKPYAISVLDFAKGFTFEQNIKSEYEKNPTKLANVINYALFAHAVQNNDLRARQLYLDAIKLVNASPLVSRAYGIYLLSSCEAPVQPNREKALELIKDAKRRDPTHLKFKTAFPCFFKYSCLKFPLNVRCILNLALIYYYIYEDLINAEKLFRRAISIAPFDERVIQNWNVVKDNFISKNAIFLSLPVKNNDDDSLNSSSRKSNSRNTKRVRI